MLITNFVSPTQHVLGESVPDWIKTNSKWWADGQISDKEFASGIGYLITKKIISVEKYSTDNDSELSISDDISIPSWIKTNSKWWADGQISDKEFLSGIEFMVDKNIIQLKSPNVSSVLNEQQWKLFVKKYPENKYVPKNFQKINEKTIVEHIKQIYDYSSARKAIQNQDLLSLKQKQLFYDEKIDDINQRIQLLEFASKHSNDKEKTQNYSKQSAYYKLQIKELEKQKNSPKIDQSNDDDKENKEFICAVTYSWEVNCVNLDTLLELSVMGHWVDGIWITDVFHEVLIFQLFDDFDLANQNIKDTQINTRIICPNDKSIFVSYNIEKGSQYSDQQMDTMVAICMEDVFTSDSSEPPKPFEDGRIFTDPKPKRNPNFSDATNNARNLIIKGLSQECRAPGDNISESSSNSGNDKKKDSFKTSVGKVYDKIVKAVGGKAGQGPDTETKGSAGAPRGFVPPDFPTSCEMNKQNAKKFLDDCDKNNLWEKSGSQCNDLVRKLNHCPDPRVMTIDPEKGDNTCNRNMGSVQTEELRQWCEEHVNGVMSGMLDEGYYDCQNLEMYQRYLDLSFDMCRNPYTQTTEEQCTSQEPENIWPDNLDPSPLPRPVSDNSFVGTTVDTNGVLHYNSRSYNYFEMLYNFENERN